MAGRVALLTLALLVLRPNDEYCFVPRPGVFCGVLQQYTYNSDTVNIVGYVEVFFDDIPYTLKAFTWNLNFVMSVMTKYAKLKFRSILHFFKLSKKANMNEYHK